MAPGLRKYSGGVERASQKVVMVFVSIVGYECFHREQPGFTSVVLT